MTSSNAPRDPEQLLLFETSELEGARTPDTAPKESAPVAFALDPTPTVRQRARTHAPEVYARAMEMYARGSSYKTVAYVLDISVYTARDWMHRYRAAGTEQEREAGKGRAFSERVRKDVRRMRYELGYSYNRIEQETGLSRTTIRSWLTRSEQDDMLSCQGRKGR